MFSQLRYVQEQLERVGYSHWKTVSEETDVPLGTIKRIGYRLTKSPGSVAIDKIAAYFQTKQLRRRKSA